MVTKHKNIKNFKKIIDMSEDRRITMRLTRIENTLEEIKRTLHEPEPPDRLITVNEAAEILHCTPQRVRDSIHEGTLDATSDYP